MELLTTEQHKRLTKEMGFEKVNCRCPVCYTEKIISGNLKEAIIAQEQELKTRLTTLREKMGMKAEDYMYEV